MYRTRFGLTGHPLPKDAQGKTFCEQDPGHERLRRAFPRLVEEPGLGVLVGAGVGRTAALRQSLRRAPDARLPSDLSVRHRRLAPTNH